MVNTFFLSSTIGNLPYSGCLLIFFSCVIAIGIIDWKHLMIPDFLSYLLLWTGLLLQSSSWQFIPTSEAVIGAAAGYLYLWLIATLFQIIMRKKGMGNGDFKCCAALCAWFGWRWVLPLILIASLIGLLFVLFRWIQKKENIKRDSLLPFGTFLAASGGLIMLYQLQDLRKHFLF